MRIYLILLIVGVGMYVGGIIGMCIWTSTPWFILNTIAAVFLMAVAAFLLIEKNYKAEIARIDKKFYEECQKIDKG